MINPNILAIIGVFALGIWSLYQLQKNFSERLFFTIGMWLFIIQALANTYGLIIQWSFLEVWSMISRIGSVSFNYLIALFFFYLKKKAPASMGGAGTTLTAKEISKFLDEEDKNETKN